MPFSLLWPFSLNIYMVGWRPHKCHYHQSLPPPAPSLSRLTSRRRGRRRPRRSRPRLAMLLTTNNCTQLYSTLGALYSSRNILYCRCPRGRCSTNMLLTPACDKSGETWHFAATFDCIPCSKTIWKHQLFNRCRPYLDVSLYRHWSRCTNRRIHDIKSDLTLKGNTQFVRYWTEMLRNSISSVHRLSGTIWLMMIPTQYYWWCQC